MKRVYVSPQKSCEPSPSKVAKVVGSEHLYASSTDIAHFEVKQLPSQAVLKIVKAAEVLFKKRVQWQRWGITYERNSDLKIQYAVLK